MAVIIETQHHKTYFRRFAPSEDFDQTAHTRSLIEIFAWCILDSQVNVDKEGSDQTSRKRRLI